MTTAFTSTLGQRHSSSQKQLVEHVRNLSTHRSGFRYHHEAVLLVTKSVRDPVNHRFEWCQQNNINKVKACVGHHHKMSCSHYYIQQCMSFTGCTAVHFDDWLDNLTFWRIFGSVGKIRRITKIYRGHFGLFWPVSDRCWSNSELRGSFAKIWPIELQDKLIWQISEDWKMHCCTDQLTESLIYQNLCRAYAFSGTFYCSNDWLPQHLLQSMTAAIQINLNVCSNKDQQRTMKSWWNTGYQIRNALVMGATSLYPHVHM